MKRQTVLFLLPLFLTLFLLPVGAMAAEIATILPEKRVAPSPANEMRVECNPPSLLWPVTDRTASYIVRLSQSKDFAEGNLPTSGPLRWAMYNPHRKLEPGTWYWQYDTLVEGKAAVPSRVLRFEVPVNARDLVTPDGSALFAACGPSHPRVLVRAQHLDAFRARAADLPDAAPLLGSAERLVGQRLPGEQAGKPTQQGADAEQAKDFAKWASKSLAVNMADDVQVLCKAYLLSGDARFAEEAKRRGLHIAAWDPDGVTAPGVSDFADGACLDAMALAYDSCHALLSPAERTLLLDAIEARAGRMFKKWANDLETRVFNAHIWQHMLAEFTHAAFATLGEIPDAELWATYAYEIWIARFPLMGGADGGWANGSNYFRTNFITLCEMPSFFGELTGVDFFGHPWYRNVPYYMMYVWPPDSASAGFGDGAEGQVRPPDASWAAFADAMSRVTGNADGGWYVNRILGDGALSGTSTLAWHRMVYYQEQPVVSPADDFDLPQARLFPDIGLAALHTDLSERNRNLMVAFRSSPYGATNHGHSSQNEFNLLFGGDRIFHNTGYYIAYGDPHFTGWYKHTRGHNSLLIDGQGQHPSSTEGFGWIPRFLNGDNVAYCVGDASNAYPKEVGLKRWRRHVVLLRPSTVIFYDDLEADHAAAWDWLLHSAHEIRQEDGLRFAVDTESASARVAMVGSTPLAAKIDTLFDPPADNWRGKKDSDGKIYKYPDQWHLTVSTASKTAVARYLALIEVQPRNASDNTYQDPVLEESLIKVGDWRIVAEMDASKPASLAIWDPERDIGIAADREAQPKGWPMKAQVSRGISTLVDTHDGQRMACFAGDSLPAAAGQEMIATGPSSLGE